MRVDTPLTGLAGLAEESPTATLGLEPRPRPSPLLCLAPPRVQTNCPVLRNQGKNPGRSSLLPSLPPERKGTGQAEHPAFLPGVSGAEPGGGAAPGPGTTPSWPRPFPGRPVPPLRQLPSRPQAPTYAAQLPIEVVPAGSLAGRVQPAQRFQHELLLRREGAALPPCASRRHGPGRPGLPTPTASRRVVPLVCSPRSGLGSALHSRPRRRQQRAHSPDLKNRPRRAPRPGQEATPALGERTLAGTGMRGGCLRGPRGLGTRALPRLPRREPRGTPRKLPGRRLLARCQGEAGGGAGSDQLRTARTAQRRRGPWGQGAARAVAEKQHL